jgi:hypothetical protein
MSLLSPLFLVGLASIAIPVLIHLIQRERKRVIEFPSLMFLRRIPYQSVRRRRIRHWLLLAMRAAALALLVFAFARPFFRQSALAAPAALGGARELVILLDQSASMGYGNHWQKAQAAAHAAVAGLGGEDRATLVLFGRNAEENIRATGDRTRLDAAINAAKVTSGATRFGPALKLAESILSRSNLPRREAVLISDFQKSGWSTTEDAHLPNGVTLTTTSVAEDNTANISVPSVAFARSSFSDQERVAVTAGIVNRGDSPVSNLSVTLNVDGRELQSEKVNIAAHASSSITFMPFTLTPPSMRGFVRAGTDALPADNTFNFVLAPSAPVSILLVSSGDRPAANLFLSKALAIGAAPAFQVDEVPAARVTGTALDKRSIIIFNDTIFPPALGSGLLKQFVERGGGVLVIGGERSTWPSDLKDVLPGKLDATVDRSSGRSATLGYLDYSHPVFEVFKAPRSGDFSSSHFFKFRSLSALDPSSHVLARYDDGGVAAAERKVGSGRVVVWTSTLDDSWTDLPVKPVFLPLVQQLARYLARYEQVTSWFTVGQVVDLAAAPGARTRGDRVIVTPSGQRVTQAAGAPGLLELAEQGVYEVRATGSASARAQQLAVNLDPTEADLTPLDPKELVAAVTGHASDSAVQAAAPAEMTREESEKRQSLWWYLLLAGVLLLATETVIANRLSRRERFL